MTTFLSTFRDDIFIDFTMFFSVSLLFLDYILKSFIYFSLLASRIWKYLKKITKNLQK